MPLPVQRAGNYCLLFWMAVCKNFKLECNLLDSSQIFNIYTVYKTQVRLYKLPTTMREKLLR